MSYSTALALSAYVCNQNHQILLAPKSRTDQKFNQISTPNGSDRFQRDTAVCFHVQRFLHTMKLWPSSDLARRPDDSYDEGKFLSVAQQILSWIGPRFSVQIFLADVFRPGFVGFVQTGSLQSALTQLHPRFEDQMLYTNASEFRMFPLSRYCKQARNCRSLVTRIRSLTVRTCWPSLKETPNLSSAKISSSFTHEG